MKNIFVCDDFKVKSLCKIAKTNKHKQKKILPDGKSHHKKMLLE